MLKIPDASQFGPKGIPVKQIDYINLMKNNGCVGCHQLGTLATRTIPAVFGTSSKDAWMQRTQAGQAGELMVNIIAGQLQAAPLGYLADWTDRIAKGELPHATPKRPEGIERNVVVTTLDWSDEKHYLHDLISTDKRNPTVNGDAARSTGSPNTAWMPSRCWISRPNRHAASGAASATRTCTRCLDPATPPWRSRSGPPPTGARRRSGPPTSTITTRRWTTKAASG